MITIRINPYLCLLKVFILVCIFVSYPFRYRNKNGGETSLIPTFAVFSLQQYPLASSLIEYKTSSLHYHFSHFLISHTCPLDLLHRLPRIISVFTKTCRGFPWYSLSCWSSPSGLIRSDSVPPETQSQPIQTLQSELEGMSLSQLASFQMPELVWELLGSTHQFSPLSNEFLVSSAQLLLILPHSLIKLFLLLVFSTFDSTIRYTWFLVKN